MINIRQKDLNATYLKNKHNLLGGGLVYNPFDDTSLLKIKTGDKGSIEYEKLNYQSNIFTVAEKREIDSFLTMVLPFFNIGSLNYPPTEEYVGIKGFTNSEVMGAGTFGITIAFDTLIIKVMRTKTPGIANELKRINVLFFDQNNQRRFVPHSINNIYGIITGSMSINADFNDIMCKTNKCNMMYSLGISTTLEDTQFDVVNMKKNYNIIKGADRLRILNGGLLFVFMERAISSLTNFYKNVYSKKQPIEQYNLIKTFLRDMRDALDFLRRNNLVHNDIKPDNIVYKIKDDQYLFQLIDFGLLANNNTPRTGGTPIFFEKTRHKNTVLFSYDWYCVMGSLLFMIGYYKSFDEFDVSSLYQTTLPDNDQLKANAEFFVINRMVDIFGPPQKDSIMNLIKKMRSLINTDAAHDDIIKLINEMP